MTLYFELVTDVAPNKFWLDDQGVVWIWHKGEVYLSDGNELTPIGHVWHEFADAEHQLPYLSIVDSTQAFWISGNRLLAQSAGRYGAIEILNLTPKEPENPIIYALLLDREGHVWLGTSEGLVCYNRWTGEFTHYRHNPSDPGSISDDEIVSLAQDSSGTIWAGTMNGLSRLVDEEAGRFVRYQYKSPPLVDIIGGYQGARIFNYLYVDKLGELWAIVFSFVGKRWSLFSFDGELVRYSRAADAFRPFSVSLQNNVTGFAQDGTGRYWIGTTEGLLTLDANTELPVPVDIRTAEGKPLRINRGRLLIDRHDVLWIPTSDGVAKTDLRRQRFERYADDPLDPQSVAPSRTDAVLLDEDGVAWIGSGTASGPYRGGGFYHFDRFTGQYTKYRSNSDDPTTLTSDAVYSISRARNDRLWIGTYDGLNLFDPVDGSAQRFYVGDEVLSRRPTPNSRVGLHIIRDIEQTDDGDLWLALDRTCTQSVCVETSELTPVRVEAGSNRLHYYTETGFGPLLIDRDGSVWMVMSKGISRYDSGSDSWQLVHEIDSLLVSEMVAARDGLIWLASRGSGLWRFDPEENTLLNYWRADSRRTSTLACVIEDEYGFIWVSSFDGLFRLHPEDGAVDRFSKADGLHNDAFSTRACDKSESGDLAFGGSNGLTIFRPGINAVNPHPPHVLLTSIRIKGARLRPGFDERLPGTLFANAVELEYGDNDISVEYTAVHHSRPEELRFEVQLEGYDPGWQDSGTRRLATYTNLDPGEYTFKVRAFNGRIQSERDADIRFVILTPWWGSWWAYALYLAAIAGVVAAVYRLRVRRLVARSRVLEDTVAERTRELQEQAVRLVELDEAKNRFFANISHEFRTPITLVLGPLQDLLDGVHGRVTQQARTQIRMMRRNTERLLHLVTQLLDLTRLDARQLEVHLEEVDLNGHLEALVHSFVPMAERKRITLEFRPETEDIVFLSDPDMLDKVVGNLLSNAIKFTPEEGRVWVTPHVTGTDGMSFAEILVKDTGPGIPKEDLEHIFDRFASFDPESRETFSLSRSHEGVGIGLALAKELVELHDGIILVESHAGSGSTFLVRLPLRPVLEQKSYLPSDGVPEDDGGIPPVESDGEPPTILVVDDNADVRAYIRIHLDNDYRIIEAENGKVGLDAARTETPDLILTDVMMPVMDGYAMCRALKEDTKLNHIPVVMLTAKAGEESTVEGLESGADEYVSKPFSMPEMKARIASLINARRRMRSRFSREVVVQPAGITIASDDAVFLKRLMEIIEAHLDDSEFSVEWLADETALSPRQLRRRVEAVTGESPVELIRRLRLERAYQLLTGGEGTVSEIARRVGYNSSSQFSKAFRKAYGISPSTAREKSPDGREEMSD
jgi:signal transduction histidine kinase/ligand-binding sensor domain-containing protein/DNA-binding response OmpR family regulator